MRINGILDLGSPSHPSAAPIVGQTVRTTVVEGYEPGVWAGGSIARTQTINFTIKAWRALGGAAANSTQAAKYLVRQVEELATSADQQPCYFEFNTTADPAALFNAFELHDGWYVIDHFEPDYSRNIVTGLVRCRMVVTHVAPGAPRRLAYAYSGGPMATTFSGTPINVLAFPLNATVIDFGVFGAARIGAEGALNAQTPRANPTPFVPPTAITDLPKGSVHVFDTLNTASNPVPLSAGTFVHANWVEVFSTDHAFVGDCVITNGFLLLLFQPTVQAVAVVYLWNTALTAAAWQQCYNLNVSDDASNGLRLQSYSLIRVGAEESAISGISTWSATGQAVATVVRLTRGMPFGRLSLSPLSTSDFSFQMITVSLPANHKIVFNPLHAADTTLDASNSAVIGASTDYGYGGVFINSTTYPFIAGLLYPNPSWGEQPGFYGSSGAITSADSLLAQNAWRNYGFFAIPYGTFGSFSTANLQAEAESGSLGTGWSSVANGAMSAGNEAKCASGTASGNADLFGATFVPTPASYDVFFRYRVTSYTGNAAEMTMGLWDTTSGSFVASTTFRANTGTYAATIMPESPAAYWRLNDTGGTAADISGGAHTGTLSGGITQSVTPSATSDTDNAMTFNGSTGVITVPTAASLHPGDTFSVELWFKTTTVTLSTMIEAGAASDWQVDILATGKIACIKRNISIIMTSTASYNDGLWHYMLWTKAGATNKLYVDGADVTPAVANVTIVGGATSITMGNGGDGFFAGSLDEVAFYGSALSAAQMAAHYGGFRTTLNAWVRVATSVVPTAGHNMRFRAVTAGTLGTDWFIDEAVMAPRSMNSIGPQELAAQFMYDRSVQMIRQ